MIEQVRACGVRIGTLGDIELKIGDTVFGFAPEDARTFANQIKQMVKRVTRRKKLTLKDKKRVW